MFPRGRVAAVAFLTSVACSLGSPIVASAHALPLSSVPAEGATVQQAPAMVEVTFGEPPDPALSSITVLDSTTTSVDSGPSVVIPGHPDQMEVPIKSVGIGVYTVAWRTVSAIDGHLAAGSFAFGVGVSAASANTTAQSKVGTPPPSALAIIARWLLFCSLILLIGLATTSLFALGSAPTFAARLAVWAWLASVPASFGIAEAERGSAGVSWSQFFSTSLGVGIAWRAASIVLLGIAVALLARAHDRWQRLWLAALGVGAGFALAVDSAQSHAGAKSPVIFNLFVQWVHITAVGVWIGGLAVLLLAVRKHEGGERGESVRRFSFTAGVCIVIVGVSGVVRAIVEIPSLEALFGTPYGVIVLAKVALFLVLATLGAVNRYQKVPLASTTLVGLKRIASTEVVIAVAVLALAAGLVNVAPPTPVVAAAPTSITVSGSDFATTVKLQLVVAPGAAGFDTFTANVNDYSTGTPVNAADVALHFSNPLRPQLGESSLILKPVGKGSFSGSGANLSIAGIWEVAAIVDNGLLSAEVDMQVTTDEAPPQVQVEPGLNGLPTLYTVQLTQGRTVQAYLDPDKPGDSEFHITYFDAQGNELTMSGAEVGKSSSGSKPVVLVTRPLDRFGHFVADASVTTGTTRFDVIGTTPDGEVLSTYVLVSIS